MDLRHIMVVVLLGMNVMLQGNAIQQSDENSLFAFEMIENIVDIEEQTERLHPDSKDQGPTNSSVSVRKQALPNSSWSRYSCCRREVNFQIKERRISRRSREIKTGSCNWNYCPTCVDSSSECQTHSLDKCSQTSPWFTFMAVRCPRRCSICRRPQVSSTSTTVNTNLVWIRKYYRSSNPRLYMFADTSLSIRNTDWRLLTSEQRIYLYRRPNGQYRTGIYFCKTRHTGRYYKWMVRRQPCRPGWTLDFKYYAASRTQQNSQTIYVGTLGRPPWSSNISPSDVRRTSYSRAFFRAYAPTNNLIQEQPAPQRDAPRTQFQRECLASHNYFRSIHGSPPLEWDWQLQRTAQTWANVLMSISPRGPRKPNRHHHIYKTAVQWPHSNQGSRYRHRRVGENIISMVDRAPLSGNVSSLHFYMEQFDYNKSHPRTSVSGRPVGHYTMMIWKDITHIGCSYALRTLHSPGFGNYVVMYVVIHYGPGGNVASSEEEVLSTYNEQVPDPHTGTCRSPSTCDVYDTCMGFNERMTCSCQRNATNSYGRPICRGRGGCMVRCKKPTNWLHENWRFLCRGEQQCECNMNIRNGKAGAFCQ
uniref:uncharacterized protein LOC100180010 isoform X1 n=1 Tax=Ciona intestinalis TaxID=7719 RepID=UPI000180B6D5|nr:uncharacterized protein LOC100180010 isoform X1 [Ciona intestinalis]|eukprot:XP_018670010.1 uncharacterized protein LOC100180010 isoform X1 [Ciona intestinalis]